MDNNSPRAMVDSTTSQPPMVFTPTLWSNIFDSFISQDEQVQEAYSKAIEELKKEVRIRLLMDAKTKTSDKLILIDTIERLGISYHFEEEIEEQLKKIFELSNSNFEDDEEHDLFSTALQFRLLRQHGYNVSCGVFNKFCKNNGNKFDEAICSDINGMLSLYEATSMRFHEEDVLEEALNFTLTHFKSVEGELDSPLQEKVTRALGQYSFHRGVPRAEARRYISLYEKDESKNEQLLRMAKLDFNFVQNMHKQELYDVSRWWTKLDIASKLPYARDRIVESYLWAVAFHFEPHYSFARIVVAKVTKMISLLNDTYDNSATLEELEIFTEVLQSWDINKTDQLADHMRIVFQAIVSLYEDLAFEASKQGRLYAVTYAKESMKRLSRAYLVEAKWFMGRKMPTFEEYIINGDITSSYYVSLSASFFAIQSTTKEAFEWMASGPLLVRSASIMGRIINDIGSYERESREGQVLTPVDCYMKQHRTSKEQTEEKFFEICEDAWKVVNKEWVSTTCIPRHILMRVLNLARITEATYKHGSDAYTTPEDGFKEDIAALFIDPIAI